MKKLILVAIALASFAFSGNAQENKVTAGVNLGLPMGDLKDAFLMNFGLDFL